MGVALVAGHNFHGYSDRIGRAFEAEGWECRVESVRPPRVRTSPVERLLYGVLPRHLGIRWPLERADAQTRADLVARVCTHDADLVVFIRPDIVTTEDLAAIRAARPRMTLACWLMDPIRRMPGVEALLPHFDHVFLYDEADLPAARPLNPRSHLLLLAFDPADYHPPVSPVAARWAVSFIGAPSSDRLRLLERVCEEFDLGPDDVRFVVGRWPLMPLVGQRRLNRRSWLFRDGYLDLETLDHTAVREVYHRSTVCLNIHQPGTVSGFNMRVFEAAGAGGAQVVERLPGLSDCFRDGREIAFYDGADELVARVGRLLEHPDEARALGASAAAAGAAGHTYQHRIRAILDACGMS